MQNTLRMETVRGEAIKERIPALAWLRVTVFRDYPYLYDGSDAYEKEYLSTYLRSDETVIVLAMDGERIVGAATGMPLDMETEEVQRPFKTADIDISSVFYFGESVLLKPYRGLGIGKKFITEREKHALSLGYAITAFCGVVRPEDHPRKPDDYRPLDSFWSVMGYEKMPGMITHFEWQDIDDERSTPKEMQFWLKKHK
jgi:GNAT superfamily N-acetyltransferase